MKKNLNEQISRIKGIMKSINEGDYDSKGNYMGGTPPEYDSPGADRYLERDVEPDGFLKKIFGKNINVMISDTKYDSGTDRGDYYESKLSELIYNDGEELPQEMIDALDSEYYSVDVHDYEDKDGNMKYSYLILDKEWYDGFATPDY